MTATYQHDHIAEIAYRAWLDRGQPLGSPEVDWYYALSVISNPEEIRMTPVDSSVDSSMETSSSQQLVQSEQTTDADSVSMNGRSRKRNPEQQRDGAAVTQRARSGRKSTDGKQKLA